MGSEMPQYQLQGFGDTGYVSASGKILDYFSLVNKSDSKVCDALILACCFPCICRFTVCLCLVSWALVPVFLIIISR